MKYFMSSGTGITVAILFSKLVKFLIRVEET